MASFNSASQRIIALLYSEMQGGGQALLVGRGSDEGVQCESDEITQILFASMSNNHELNSIQVTAIHFS